MCPTVRFRFFPVPAFGPRSRFRVSVPLSSRMPLTTSPLILPTAAILPFNTPNLRGLRFLPQRLRPSPRLPNFPSRPHLVEHLGSPSALTPNSFMQRQTPSLHPSPQRWRFPCRPAMLPPPHSRHLPRFPFTRPPQILLRRPHQLTISIPLSTSLLCTVR